MSVQSSSGSLEGPPSWSQLSTSPTPGSAAAARSLLNHTPPSGRPREGKCRRARARSRAFPSRAGGPPRPPHSCLRPRGVGGWWRGGREAARLRGGGRAGCGWWFAGGEGDGRGAERRPEGTGRGAAHRTDSPGFLGARPPGWGAGAPDASPSLLRLPEHSVLLTSWPPVSGGFSLPWKHSSPSPLPFPSRTPPLEAVLAPGLGCSDPGGGWPPCAGALPSEERRRDDRSRL